MKFGAHSLLWTPKFSQRDLTLFDKLQSFGFNGLEIHLDDLSILPKEGIKQKMKETGIRATFTAVLDAEHNLNSFIIPDYQKRIIRKSN